MQIDSKQMRAARALLQWTQEDIAEKSGVSLQTIKNTESDRSYPHAKSMDAIQRSFEDAGVEFTDRSGVKLKEDFVNVLTGDSAMERFFDDIYSVMQKNNGGDVLICGVEEKAYTDLDSNLVERHLDRMEKLGTVKQKVLCRHGDYNFTVPYAEYRWLQEEAFFSAPFYVYGDKLAVILWGNPQKIIILNFMQMAKAYANQFKILWQNAIMPDKKAKR